MKEISEISSEKVVCFKLCIWLCEYLRFVVAAASVVPRNVLGKGLVAAFIIAVGVYLSQDYNAVTSHYTLPVNT